MLPRIVVLNVRYLEIRRSLIVKLNNKKRVPEFFTVSILPYFVYFLLFCFSKYGCEAPTPRGTLF